MLVFVKSHCPHCNGNLYVDEDRRLTCLMCVRSYTVDMLRMYRGMAYAKKAG